MKLWMLSLLSLAFSFGLAKAGDADTYEVATGSEIHVLLGDPAERLSVADPAIADIVVIGPKELLILGKTPGSTSLLIWTGKEHVRHTRIEVHRDFEGIRRLLRKALPQETRWNLEASGHDLVLMGRVSDLVALHHLENLVSNYLKSGTSGAAGGQVINLLEIDSPQQVLLHVQVAEVSKSFFEQWGGKVSYASSSASLMSDLSSTSSSSIGFSVVSGLFSGGLHLTAEEGVIRTLAEPTLMALSGQEANFLAGGKVFVPISQTLPQGTTVASLEEKEFGVALKFTPTVMKSGVIHLKVAPEVSEINTQGLGLSTNGGASQTVLPVFSSRRASTTVELHEGESLVIGGLNEHTHQTTLQRFPWLGDIPAIGILFRNAMRQDEDQELVFIVTPSLVTETRATPVLPTMRSDEPTRQEFFLEGRSEGKVKILSTEDLTSVTPAKPILYQGETLLPGFQRVFKSDSLGSPGSKPVPLLP